MKYYESINDNNNNKNRSDAAKGSSVNINNININSYDDFIGLCPKTLQSIEEFNEALLVLNKGVQTLESVNSKGFVNSIEIRDYPIVGSLVNEYVNLNDPQDPSLGFKELEKWERQYLYIWLNMLVRLQFLNLSSTCLNNLNIRLLFLTEEYKVDPDLCADDLKAIKDLINDFQNLEKDVMSKLHPLLRRCLQKKGIGFIQNIYTGFDTEYKQIDSTHNELISVQLANTSKTILRLPIMKEFKFEGFDVSSDRGYKSGFTRSEDRLSFYGINWLHLDASLNDSIAKIRDIKYRVNDVSIQRLVTGLKERGIDFIEKDDTIYFIFQRSVIKEWFKLTKTFSFEDLLEVSKNLSMGDLARDEDFIKTLLMDIYKGSDSDSEKNYKGFGGIKGSLDERKSKVEGLDRVDCSKNIDLPIGADPNNKYNKKYVRSYNQSYTDNMVSVTRVVNNYILAHNTPADFSMLSDFEALKGDLDIVNKSFVTLKKPILMKGMNVIIRDTMLLSPGRKRLESLALMYDNIKKVEVSHYYKSNMDLLVKDNFELFKSYAMMDAVISLIHGCFMEDFNLMINGVGIPLTLSSLSRMYILKYWSDNNYGGYQVSNKYLLGNASRSLTPKGLGVLKSIGVKTTMYSASYKGGRNESFMYGFEFTDKVWYDYDIVSAYTSAMSMMGDPNYEGGKVLQSEDVKSMSDEQLIFSYTVLDVEFEFPSSVKFPSIPAYVDEVVTVYPLTGRSIITGIEYVLALRQGSKMNIKDGYTIPFKSVPDFVKDKVSSLESIMGDEVVLFKPFSECIKELQRLRGKYKKGTINNLLYKEIGNSLYGLTVRGLNEKLKYDIKTNSMVRMEGDELSNPIIASWITSFIRCVIGELLHYTDKLGGKIVSVTTDGFITDISGLEGKILNLDDDPIMLKFYKSARRELSGNDTGLELKNSGSGILSWCTRGQLSARSGIVATTGFQRQGLDLFKLEESFIKILKGESESDVINDDNEDLNYADEFKCIRSEREGFDVFESLDKSLIFLKKQLRSAKDIFKNGGHVTMKYSDQVFRLLFDNKRFIVDSKDESVTLLDSNPLSSVDDGRVLRTVSAYSKNSLYSKTLGSVSKSYKSVEEIAVRNFVKALLKEDLNLKMDCFNGYSEIVSYIQGYGYNLTSNYISQLKRRGNYVKVPKTIETINFVEYVKIKFPDFDVNGFFISD